MADAQSPTGIWTVEEFIDAGLRPGFAHPALRLLFLSLLLCYSFTGLQPAPHGIKVKLL